MNELQVCGRRFASRCVLEGLLEGVGAASNTVKRATRVGGVCGSAASVNWWGVRCSDFSKQCVGFSSFVLLYLGFHKQEWPAWCVGLAGLTSLLVLDYSYQPEV